MKKIIRFLDICYGISIYGFYMESEMQDYILERAKSK